MVVGWWRSQDSREVDRQAEELRQAKQDRLAAERLYREANRCSEKAVWQAAFEAHKATTKAVLHRNLFYVPIVLGARRATTRSRALTVEEDETTAGAARRGGETRWLGGACGGGIAVELNGELPCAQGRGREKEIL